MKSNNSRTGVVIIGVVQILLIGLRCLNLIAWPWWKVFTPLLVYLWILVLYVLLIMFVDVFEDL